jgi:hypothetical protein
MPDQNLRIREILTRKLCSHPSQVRLRIERLGRISIFLARQITVSTLPPKEPIVADKRGDFATSNAESDRCVDQIREVSNAKSPCQSMISSIILSYLTRSRNNRPLPGEHLYCAVQ